MLTKDIQAILTRAMSDRAFADELFANTDEALASYPLNEDEIRKLKRLFSIQADGHSSTASESWTSCTLTEPERDTDDQT